MSSRRVKMWPTASVKACWLCVVLAAVPALSDHIVYKKVGDGVVLKPDSVPDPITSITWGDGANLAIVWEKNDKDITYYRHFKERGSLNTSNGEMTITGLFRNDSGGYAVEINNVKVTSIDLRVISAVPEPTVSPSCDDEKTSCTLTCDGNTTGAEPVTYTWKSDDTVITTSTQKQHAIEEDSSSIKQFSCELKNPVSQESSKPIPNPLIDRNSPEEGLHPKINTGVTVFICLLVPLLLLVFIHRCKAGMWFYEKESMPWEGDFWRKNEKKHEPKSTAARQVDQTEEETPMAQPNNGESRLVERQTGSEMF